MLNDRRATPCEIHDDGKDFVRDEQMGRLPAITSRPLPGRDRSLGRCSPHNSVICRGRCGFSLGPCSAARVQDFAILFCSMRRNGKSLGQMVKEELNSPVGFIAALAILAILVIMLAVLALVVVKALAESPGAFLPWGQPFPSRCSWAVYMRFWRVGKVLEASAIGAALLLLAVWGGKLVYENSHWSQVFGLRDITLAWAIIVYGLAASVLPVWLPAWRRAIISARS